RARDAARRGRRRATGVKGTPSRAPIRRGCGVANAIAIAIAIATAGADMGLITRANCSRTIRQPE
ncbi:hypothetical protein, partial [Burkholderia thailandensis]|uniref:hypothetical protein n=1 Tax=Burkholderia thailandensis TaxID=57975 RepID=UPI001ED90526